MFERIDYVVKDLAGDYAYLAVIGREEEEPKCVARALLPPETNVGSRLAYEMMEYTVIG
ncbi:MAG: chorismate--pyruvate lyase [Candidatus Limivivens sp.]|nr:chorismate--pyruvate lyase [Candidatus Limivivens sp.]